jgi:hypothetical protein
MANEHRGSWIVISVARRRNIDRFRVGIRGPHLSSSLSGLNNIDFWFEWSS